MNLTVEDIVDRTCDVMDVNIYDCKEPLDVLSNYDGRNSIDPKYLKCPVTDFYINSGEITIEIDLGKEK